MSTTPSPCVDVFLSCRAAIKRGILIRRVGRKDKEFHFQNWLGGRLDELRIAYDEPKRNTYPDFRLVNSPDGFEVKALAFPGRDANYDSNSQAPSGSHRGRTIYYVFGRYPAEVDEDRYPVIDLVICHGDFLNADHEYVHKNKSVKGFGSYGDIMIRDRKMYVVPTPFALTSGTTAQFTLILQQDAAVDRRLEPVGELARIEAEKLVVGYSFDLRTNAIVPRYVDNPGAGRRHDFVAYRPRGAGGPRAEMKISTGDAQPARRSRRRRA